MREAIVGWRCTQFVNLPYCGLEFSNQYYPKGPEMVVIPANLQLKAGAPEVINSKAGSETSIYRGKRMTPLFLRGRCHMYCFHSTNIGFIVL